METKMTSSLKVLVVDDDEAVRRLLSIVLPLDGKYEIVGEAADGYAAIAAAEMLQPDIIVLDHMMPALTGAAAYPTIRRGRSIGRCAVLLGLPRAC
ncbi:MAG: response regulator [Actinobacteria bacterium]|nr:response regulator [Actinomycetota bacterium]